MSKILVVDDEINMQVVLRAMLKKEGYEVLTVANGQEALISIAASAPDLLLTDINMPRMNGFELVKEVRVSLGLTGLPIIILTTETSDKSQELAFNLGADDYIKKPFNSYILLARVKAALRRIGKLK